MSKLMKPAKKTTRRLTRIDVSGGETAPWAPSKKAKGKAAKAAGTAGKAAGKGKL